VQRHGDFGDDIGSRSGAAGISRGHEVRLGMACSENRCELWLLGKAACVFLWSGVWAEYII